MGNIVHVYSTALVTLTVMQGFAVPSDYRPKTLIYKSGVYNNGSSYIATLVMLLPDGTIKVANSNGSNVSDYNSCMFDFIYMI